MIDLWYPYIIFGIIFSFFLVILGDEISVLICSAHNFIIYNTVFLKTCVDTHWSIYKILTVIKQHAYFKTKFWISLLRKIIFLLLKINPFIYSGDKLSTTHIISMNISYERNLRKYKLSLSVFRKREFLVATTHCFFAIVLKWVLSFPQLNYCVVCGCHLLI